jgi:hypothetical protein
MWLDYFLSLSTWHSITREYLCHHPDITWHDGTDEQDVGWRNGWCRWGIWLRSCGIVADLSSNPNPTWTQNNQHGPDDRFRTINYHHLDISGHDGMDEQDVGLRNVWCWCGKLLSSWRIVADFSSNCNPTWTQHNDQHGHIRTWWNGWAGCWLEKWLGFWLRSCGISSCF